MELATTMYRRFLYVLSHQVSQIAQLELGQLECVLIRGCLSVCF